MAERYRIKLNDEEIDLSRMSFDERNHLAINSKDINVLKKLSTDKHNWVRANVAENPNCPLDLLKELVEDEDELVRANVARNPNCPVDILEKLAKDEGEYHWARREVAGNPNTPVDLLRELVEDEDEETHKNASRNIKGKNMKITSKSFSIIKVSPDTDYKEANVKIKFKIDTEIEDICLQFFIEEDVLDIISDSAKQYCEETGKDFEEVVEQLDNYYVDFSTLEEEAETKFEDAISDLNLHIGDKEYKSIISKIVNSAKKCIKENFSYDQELVDDFNNWYENN